MPNPPPMQRRHFEYLAGFLKRQRVPNDSLRDLVVDYMARDLAGELAHSNRLFDRDKFLDACGVSSYSKAR